MFAQIALERFGGETDPVRSDRALVRPDQPSYLKDSCNRVRYSVTLPSSIFTSIFTTSAIRKSRSVPAAVCTAVFAASSQDWALVPMTSVTLYTDSVDLSLLAIIFPFYLCV